MARPKNPPENLVIYEVQGVLDPPERFDPGPGFLGFWVEGDYTFIFFEREADLELKPLLVETGLTLRYIHRLKYKEWQDGAGFAPFDVGPLTIVPAWRLPEKDSFDPSAGRLAIFLDPGLVFGFGGHPTTLACLKFLVRVWAEDRPAEVLDLGAGTGILALAAARLGARRILAVDSNHLAVETARANVVLNALEDKIEVVRGRAEDRAATPAELVLANLHFQVQEELLLRGGFDRRRWLILSGLFHRQVENLEASLKEKGFRLLDRLRDERWTSLLMRGE
ncbi:MAG: 50S ribosomal protein L11 methyltransferase [Thermodesulfobacteriota bacterium]